MHYWESNLIVPLGQPQLSDGARFDSRFKWFFYSYSGTQGSSLTSDHHSWDITSQIQFSYPLPQVVIRLAGERHCLRTPYRELWLTSFPKIVSYCQDSEILTQILLWPSIYFLLVTLLVYRLVLLLFLMIPMRPLCLLQVDMNNPLTPCILSSDVNMYHYFECQLGRQRKLSLWEELPIS